jgi:hypothetical protein
MIGAPGRLIWKEIGRVRCKGTGGKQFKQHLRKIEQILQPAAVS